MSEYKLTPHGSVTRNSDGASIPADPTNIDYAEFLRWQAAGGIPDPVDPPTTAEMNAPILAQIAVLDAYIPRGLEDLIAGLGFDVANLPEIQQQRLAQKAALRLQLVK